MTETENTPTNESAPVEQNNVAKPIANEKDKQTFSDIKNEINNLNGELLKKEQILDRLKQSGSEADKKTIENTQKQLNQIKASSDAHKEMINKIERQGGSMAGLSKTHSDLEKNIAQNKGSFDKFSKSASDTIGDVAQSIAPLTKLLGAAVPLATATAAVKLKDLANTKLGGIFDIQADVLKFNKEITNMSMSFGKSFGDAQGTLGNFKGKWADTISLVKASAEDIKNVQQAFANTVPIEKQIETVQGLGTAASKINAPLNMMNAAILAGAATGTDAAEVSKWMGESYYNMGASVQEAAESLGKIKWAAEGSGVSFEQTGKSIMSSAKSLQMWGGTVASVAPLFKSFSDAMTGSKWGRAGLTPELFQSWVDGISKMNFATRALFGMQAPGMQGKGAIGAGLEMEAAMEDKTGEGMKKVSESIMASLKQFGGGKVLTREEAIADPSQEKNFIIQRSLLMQQMGMDQATANKTLNMLQQIDKNGIDSGGGAEEKLGELLNSGQKVQEATQSINQQLANDQVKATQQSGEKIVGAIAELGGKMGITKLFSDFGKRLSEVTARGNAKPEDVENVYKDFNKAIVKATKNISGESSSKTKKQEPKEETTEQKNRRSINESLKRSVDIEKANKKTGRTDNAFTMDSKKINDEVNKNKGRLDISKINKETDARYNQYKQLGGTEKTKKDIRAEVGNEELIKMQFSDWNKEQAQKKKNLDFSEPSIPEQKGKGQDIPKPKEFELAPIEQKAATKEVLPDLKYGSKKQDKLFNNNELELRSHINTLGDNKQSVNIEEVVNNIPKEKQTASNDIRQSSSVVSGTRKEEGRSVAGQQAAQQRQAIEQEIPVKVSLSAKVSGTSLTLDLKPMLEEAAKNLFTKGDAKP